MLMELSGGAEKKAGRLFNKKQVCAKGKPNVYGLTPAQCRKVKGSGASRELKPR